MRALRILLISICVTSIQSNSSTTNNGTGLIAHGKPFVYKDYPYVVGIVLTLKNISYVTACTGTLVSELYVLTAAHCVFEKNELADASRLTIHQYTLDSKTIQKVEKVYLRDDYVSGGHADVCVLKMKGPFDTATKFVKLYGDITDIGEEGLACTVIGFGVDEDPAQISRFEGQTADIILLAGAKSCALGTGKYLKYWDEFICQKPSETHTCPGDSGGPVICNGVQYGLTSHGFTYTHDSAEIKCGSAETLMVYQYVKFYKDWIDNIIVVKDLKDAAIRPHQKMYTLIVILTCHVLTLKLYFNNNN